MLGFWQIKKKFKLIFFFFAFIKPYNKIAKIIKTEKKSRGIFCICTKYYTQNNTSEKLVLTFEIIESNIK